MIKKITNWTFGSIFRTIGRFLAYIIIGIIISLLFIKKDYVKAMSLDGNYYGQRVVNSSEWSGTFYRTHAVNYTVQAYTFGTSFNSLDADYMQISLLSYMYIEDINTFNEHVGDTSGSGTYPYTFYNENAYMVLPRIRLMSNGPWQTCELQNNVIVCPLAHNVTYTGLYIEMNMPQSTTFQDSGWYLTLNSYVDLYKTDGASITNSIDSQTQAQQQQHNETMQVITGEVNGTGENGTITDEDAESASCGIICKLKHLIKMLSIDNIKYLVIPTEEQMNDLFEQMQTKVTSKLGILGLPITVYTRLMQIAMQYDDNQQNWCLTWNNVQVPNFEDFNIIEGGQWCFSDILQNEKINTFRTVCITIIGGLILLSFIQYLFNCLHRILDVPIQDNYEYFTVEDVTTMDPVTGEVRGTQHKERRTRKLEVNE